MAGASEIDDIFAAKGAAKARPSHKPLSPAASTSQAPASSSSADKKKKKKKDKKRKREADSEHAPADGPAGDDTGDVRGEPPAKRRVPETVLDPSATRPQPTKPPKAPHPRETKTKHKKHDKEDEQRFKDSRGTGPSTFTVFNYLTLACNVCINRAQNGGRVCYLQRGRARNHRKRRRQVSTYPSIPRLLSN